MSKKGLGFSNTEVIIVRGAEVNRDETFNDRSDAFKHSINSLAAVEDVARSGGVPLGGYNFATGGVTLLNSSEGEEVQYNILMADDHYLQTYGIPLIAGEPFTNEMCRYPFKDIKEILINETAAGALGLSPAEAAVGKTIQWEDRAFRIRGVVKDYHHQPLQFAISPIIFMPSQRGAYYSIKVDAKNLSSHVAEIARHYRASFPGNPFEYQFLTSTVENAYEKEARYNAIFIIASTLAIFIACLGLFGLATLNVAQRVKEIGVRKVLGAASRQIVMLIGKQFAILMAISFLLAAPMSYVIVQSWLSDFAYHTSLSWTTYAIAAVVTAGVAGITVGIKAWQGASVNPVQSLRSE